MTAKKTVTVKIPAIVIEVNPETWIEEYGNVTAANLPKAVIAYVMNQLNQSAAAEARAFASVRKAA